MHNDEIGSGIYLITDTTTGRRYVGRSKNITRRWQQHKSRLVQGIHHNQHLQHIYNQYGSAGFQFQVLQLCPEDVLIETEAYYISHLQPELNMMHDYGDGVLRHTDETRAQIATSHILRYAKNPKPFTRTEAMDRAQRRANSNKGGPYFEKRMERQRIAREKAKAERYENDPAYRQRMDNKRDFVGLTDAERKKLRRAQRKARQE